MIHDFDPDRDTIDLRPIDAVVGGRNSAFDWIGRAGFSDTAGELRIAGRGGDLWLRGDTDGDGRADLAHPARRSRRASRRTTSCSDPLSRSSAPAPRRARRC